MEARETARVLFNSFVGKVQGAEGGILNSNLSRQCANLTIDEICNELKELNAELSETTLSFSEVINKRLNRLAKAKQEINKFENSEWIK